MTRNYDDKLARDVDFSNRCHLSRRNAVFASWCVCFVIFIIAKFVVSFVVVLLFFFIFLFACFLFFFSEYLTEYFINCEGNVWFFIFDTSKLLESLNYK